MLFLELVKMEKDKGAKMICLQGAKNGDVIFDGPHVGHAPTPESARESVQ